MMTLTKKERLTRFIVAMGFAALMAALVVIW